MIADTARRWWALVAIAVCVLVVGLDLTVLNLALPTLARDLHASNGDLQWFASVYSLTLAAALLPAGLLGDRFGRKKVLLAGLAVFGVSSAACACYRKKRTDDISDITDITDIAGHHAAKEFARRAGITRSPGS